MQDFAEIAVAALESAPCSLEMPAGTGKTQLIVCMIRRVADDGGRALVLTHTNAGVAAITRRCRQLEIPRGSFRIMTICSWAESVANAYRRLSDFDATKTREDKGYYEACEKAAVVAMSSDLFHKLLVLSYSSLLVDEYQDCSMLQHQLIEAMAESISATVVLGDRLQRIFDFKGDPFPDWTNDVERSFRQFAGLEPYPHRWSNGNQELGDWLLQYVRPKLLSGQRIDYASASMPGYEHLRYSIDMQATIGAAYKMARRGGNSLIVCPNIPPTSGEKLASRLSGTYSYMEEIEGSFLKKEIIEYEKSLSSGKQAYWLAQFARKCFSGFGTKSLDSTVLKAIDRGCSLAKYTRSRPGFTDALMAFDEYSNSPNLSSFKKAYESIEESRQGKIYRREAWRDTLKAIQGSFLSGSSPAEELSCIRNQLKYQDSRGGLRTVSRTLLVKGLEYDHVIVNDAERINNPNNLYVALTRPKMTLTVIG